jgi:hypothetical protein
MPLTNAGRDDLVQTYKAAKTFFLGIGDSTTAFSATHTDLQASTNKLRKAMDATYPQGSANALTFKSTFATGDGNFQWQEYGVFTSASGGTMFSRKVENLGTKVSGTWVLTVVVTINN